MALETLRIYEEDRILEQVARVAPRFQQRLRALAERPFVGEARGIGLIGAIELVADKATRQSFDMKHTVGAVTARNAEAEGLIIRPIYDSIAFAPPLIITEVEIDGMFDRFERTLDQVEPTFRALRDAS